MSNLLQYAEHISKTADMKKLYFVLACLLAVLTCVFLAIGTYQDFKEVLIEQCTKPCKCE